MVGNDLKLDEGIGICGKEGQSVPVGVGIPTDQDRPYDRRRHGLSELAGGNRRTGNPARDGAGLPTPNARSSEGSQFSVNVRMREIGELLTEAGSRGAGVRVLVGKNTGSAYTSDLTEDGIRQMVGSATGSCGDHDRGSVCGTAEARMNSARWICDLQLLCPAVQNCRRIWKIEQAKRAEDAAFAVDSRIFEFGRRRLRHSHRTSRVREFARFRGELPQRQLLDQCNTGGRRGRSMERDYWYSVARDPGGSKPPSTSGGERPNGRCAGWERGRCRRRSSDCV